MKEVLSFFSYMRLRQIFGIGILFIFVLIHSSIPVSGAELNLEAVDFGYSDVLRLSGTEAEQTISIPVEQGYIPETIAFTSRSTPTITEGFVAIESQGIPIDTIPHSTESAQHVISLTNVNLPENVIPITFRSIAEVENKAVCDAKPSTWVDIRDIEITALGDPRPPETIKDFWSPTMQTIHFYFGQNPKKEFVASAITMANFAQRQTFGNDIEVKALMEDTPSTASATFTGADRVVVFEEASQTNIQLEPIENVDSSSSAILRVQAPADAVADFITQTMTERATELLVTDELRGQVGLTDKTPQRPQVTFQDLGYDKLTMKGTGTMSQEISLSQSDFGNGIEDLKVTLTGKHSVLEGNPSATLNVYFNDSLVSSRPISSLLDMESSFTMTIDIPDEKLQRDNVLGLVVDYTSKQGECKGLHPLTVDFDNTSFFEAQPIMKYIPHFDRYPQILHNHLFLAVDLTNETTVEQAIQLVALLQKLTPHALQATILNPADVQQNYEPLIVVTQDQDVITSYALPMKSELVRSDTLMRGKFAFLHAFTQGPQRILMLGSENWEGGGRALLSYLRENNGWYATRDDTMIMNQNGDVGFTQVNTKQITLSKWVDPNEESTSPQSSRWYYYLGIPVAGIIALIITILVYRKRGKK